MPKPMSTTPRSTTRPRQRMLKSRTRSIMGILPLRGFFFLFFALGLDGGLLQLALQHERAGCHHALSGLEAVENRHAVALRGTNLDHALLVPVIARLDEYDRLLVDFLERSRRNHDSRAGIGRRHLHGDEHLELQAAV